MNAVYWVFCLFFIFRFPVPDLSYITQLAPQQWWRRNLRKEVLLLSVHSLRFHTCPVAANHALYELTCSQIEGAECIYAHTYIHTLKVTLLHSHLERMKEGERQKFNTFTQEVLSWNPITLYFHGLGSCI